MLELSPALLAQLIRAVEDGLCSFEPGVSMQCCSTIDNIVTFFYQKLSSPEPEGQVRRVFSLLAKRLRFVQMGRVAPVLCDCVEFASRR